MLLLCSVVVVTLQATSYEYFIAVCGFNTLFDHHFIRVELSWDECSFAVPNGTLNLCNGVVNVSANIICNCILITTDCMTLSHHLSLSNCWNHKSAPLQLYTSQSNQPKPRFLNVPHSHVLAGLAYHVDQSKYVVLEPRAAACIFKQGFTWGRQVTGYRVWLFRCWSVSLFRVIWSSHGSKNAKHYMNSAE